MFIGASVNVNSRQLTIRDYGDEYSRRNLVKQMESTLLIIKPDGYQNMGKIIDAAIQNQFTICQVHMLQLSNDEAAGIVKGSSPVSPELIQSFCGGRSVALELMLPNGVELLSKLVGPDSFEEAKRTAPNSLRARFGSSDIKNAVYAPNNKEEAKQQLSALLSDGGNTTATFKHCTLGIIRPHAFIAGQSGKIIDEILGAGFSITDIQLFNLDRSNGEDFLEVYKGVVPEYTLMLDQMTAGPLIAMEISGDDDVTTKFREFVGPSDPELAKQVRPQSLRARFGVDKVRNAIHCTDLPDDGILETQFFFRILQQ